MLDLAQTQLARRLWRICKLFQLPLSDSRIQNMSIFELEFYENSIIADDPKLLKKLQNHFFDPEYEEWEKEFDEEQKQNAPTWDFKEYEVVDNKQDNNVQEETLEDDDFIDASGESQTKNIDDWEVI